MHSDDGARADNELQELSCLAKTEYAERSRSTDDTDNQLPKEGLDGNVRGLHSNEILSEFTMPDEQFPLADIERNARDLSSNTPNESDDTDNQLPKEGLDGNVQGLHSNEILSEFTMPDEKVPLTDIERNARDLSSNTSNESEGQAHGQLQKEVLQKILKQPKKPLSPYMRFSKSVWAKVKEQNAGLSVCQIGASIGKMWRELSQEEKTGYSDDFAADKVKYDEDIQKYLKLTGLQPSDLVKPRSRKKKHQPAPAHSFTDKHAPFTSTTEAATRATATGGATSRATGRGQAASSTASSGSNGTNSPDVFCGRC